MLAMASLVMSFLLKLLEVAMKTKTGTAGVGGGVAALGIAAVSWAVCKAKELWNLSEEVGTERGKGLFLFSWLSPSVIAKNHENVIAWIKLQGPEVQQQYKEALGF